MKPIVKKASEEEKNMASSWPVWEKEESIFPWQYDEEESCLILEGKAIVEFKDGMVEFGKGDYVVFPEGLKCKWNIKEKIRKHYKLG